MQQSNKDASHERDDNVALTMNSKNQNATLNHGPSSSYENSVEPRAMTSSIFAPKKKLRIQFLILFLKAREIDETEIFLCP